MSNRSGLLARQREQQAREKALFEEGYKAGFAEGMAIGERIACQLMLDCDLCVLNDRFGFGYDRLREHTDLLMAEYDELHACIDAPADAIHDERYVLRRRLDGRIGYIMRDHPEKFIPFEERYPDVKKTEI